MAWLQLSLTATADEADGVSDVLSALGAAAVTIRPEDGADVLEPAPGAQPLAARNSVTGLFQGDASESELRAALSGLLGEQRAATLRVATLEDSDWESAWRQQAAAREYGDGLWVVPHDHESPAAARAVVRLDPGLAFGTGAHPTTALCLEWLASQPLEGLQVVDFGCGSGVLAIAAAHLGAAGVYAVDHDPQALEATRDNAERNGVADRIHITDEPPGCDVLVANILANALDALAPRFAGLVRPGGALALSGILPAQADALNARYAVHFRMGPVREAQDWVLLTGRRR